MPGDVPLTGASGPESPRAADGAEELGLAAVAGRARQEAERQAIEQALLISRWRRTEAARRLKISYRTLLRKMREYGLG
jgi:DNA-binding NtrC family response regulator